METIIKLRITEQSRMCLHDELSTFNVIIEVFHSVDELISYLKDRYGRVPNGRNKIYLERAGNEGEPPIVTGFMHSYWNQDISHNSKKWYQTDWIEFCEERVEYVYFKLPKR